jgi:integrase
MIEGHIRQRSPGSWELRWRANGKTATKTVRGTKTDAKRALREALGRVDRGEHVEPTKLTVAQLVKQRIEAWQGAGRCGQRTVENYTDLATIIDTGLGSLLVQKLTTLDVERWHLDMTREQRASRTIRAAHRLLARTLGEAVRHNLVVRNVAADQGPPSAKPAERVAMPDADQVAALRVKLIEDPWMIPVEVALGTGLRRGEQLALRWSRVDLDGAKLHVVEALDETRAHGVAVKLPKTSAGRRTITLPAFVVEALRAHRKAQLELAMRLGQGRPADDALVFPGDDGGHQGPNAFSKRWSRKAAKVGMPEITWHGLRHAHASALIAARVPVTEVAARLGHADPTVTLRVYAHLFSKDDRSSAAAIDAAFAR